MDLSGGVSAATVWWAIAAVLVVAELLTGTFYLLMLALGAAAAALAAHAGAGLTAQLVAAAILGGGGTAAWHWRRARAPRSAPSESNPDVNLDIGHTVQVAEWQPDGSTRVQHRGAAWSARLAAGQPPGQPGPHRIVALQGNQLVLAAAGGTGSTPG